MLMTLDFSRWAMTMLMHVIGMFSIMHMMFLLQNSNIFLFQ
jgi:hypothetical protein